MNRITRDGGAPQPVFSNLNAVAVLVGIVIGIGIFRLPPLVASNAGSEFEFLAFWVAGGAISLIGALCYAELAAAYPDAGGEYHFLSRAYGSSLGFLFSWGRMTVIQTGSIALAGFILGDYASRVLPLGSYSSTIYAALTVIGLTALNLWGTNPSKKTQNIVTTVIVVVLLLAAFLGITQALPAKGSFTSPDTGTMGAAMIFVLLTYGGWNEVSYLSGEIKNVKQNMVRVLAAGIGVITLIYVSVNYAFLHVLGLEGLRNTQAVGADLTAAILGSGGAILLSFIVIIAALSTANATIITGARTNYALGRDFSFLKFLGTWSPDHNTPVNALLVQGGIALLLVVLGAVTEDAVSTMVDYTAPVFWFFFMLTGISLFIFRFRNGSDDRPYSVPFYPVTPILFILTCLYMLYSSLTFTGIGALFGVGILLVGIPVLLIGKLR
ncbi:amino acid permease [Aliifodinibius sp. S!AR15-10]|uniref:APC family permease n=1 Tax=Aliifodinibius sp. S!AR15-10 TaxID=2950437 RepID=UPI0028642D5D|nr:amino acid permease [Aliifodinibius sp. S!AR15-10]MDR8394051.1 amino acid permease [Aliifodinibius sp. S!AR15-10]